MRTILVRRSPHSGPYTMVQWRFSVPGPARLLWGIILVALMLRLGFWIYTERTWEDALITVRHAENAAAGRGLTHHPAQGPPIHGFTSPISVLIPLLGEFVARGSGLAVLRISSLVATVITLILAWRLAQHPRIALSPAATTLFLGYLAMEHHQILFGMAGMETQWIVAITLLGMWAGLEVIEYQPSTALAGTASPWRLGIGLGTVCGLALWGRPDGVILILAIAFAIGVWGRWGLVVPVILGCVLCLAPWIAFRLGCSNGAQSSSAERTICDCGCPPRSAGWGAGQSTSCGVPDHCKH
ncbi:MAG: hypothetical protein B7Z55_04155 [Planctomycetales bacterium 12-60-4]|nr:MAG: hypothetical protein B7Z55_04155 [Planctomycetales bacterium 12-60-4]